jgi:bifunctional non-homologous end joining protein LigD
MLADILGESSKSSLLRYSDHAGGDGKAVLASACKLGLEGIISKHINRPYHSGPSSAWLKSKCLRSDPFVIFGYTLRDGSELIGALALGYYDGESLTYAGLVGTGFTEREALAMGEALRLIRTDRQARSIA